MHFVNAEGAIGIMTTNESRGPESTAHFSDTLSPCIRASPLPGTFGASGGGGGTDAAGSEGSAATAETTGRSLASEGGPSGGGSATMAASAGAHSQEQLQQQAKFQNGSQAHAAVPSGLGLGFGEKDVKSQARAQPDAVEEQTSTLEAALAQVLTVQIYIHTVLDILVLIGLMNTRSSCSYSSRLIVAILVKRLNR